MCIVKMPEKWRIYGTFREMVRVASAVFMPLDTEAPAGLTVYFQAAANNKMIITSDTVTTEGYLCCG